MDLTTQKERYSAVANKLNEYTVRARQGIATATVDVTFTSVEAAETLQSLGQMSSTLAWALSLPGDDEKPEIQSALDQLDVVLDAMAKLWEGVTLSEEAVNLIAGDLIKIA